MSYTPKEISTIAELFTVLVERKQINFEIDSFGNPVQRYSEQAMRYLTNAIKRLPSFPRKCVVENAMLETSTCYSGEIFAASCGDIPRSQVAERMYSNVEELINAAAFLDISDKLFTTKQIQAMLRQHPDYLSTRESDIRIGKLEREEMEDIARPKTGILSADEFNKTFSEVA